MDQLINEVQRVTAEAVIKTIDTAATPESKSRAARYYYRRYCELITESLSVVVAFARLPRVSLEYTQADFEEIKMNDAAKRMQYDGLIFSALDRLGRNARHISAMRGTLPDTSMSGAWSTIV